MSAPHNNAAYVPHYMMKQSLWNMEQQISQMRGLIKPKTRLMAWQPFLIAQAQRDVQNIYNSLAYSATGKGYGGIRPHHPGAQHHSYGEYGANCGTFLQINVTDPHKKACVLEKKIAHYRECCENNCSGWNPATWFTAKGGNQQNQCRKLAEAQAELDLIMGQLYGTTPTTVEQATDIAMENLRTEEAIADKKAEKEKAKLTKTLIMAGGTGLFLILAIAILR